MRRLLLYFANIPRRLLSVGLLGAAGLSVGADLVAAQQGTVGGTVLESRSLRPLAGAQVVVTGQGRGVITDGSGRFRLTGVTGTEVTIEVVMIGYRARTQAARVGDLAVRIALTETAIELNEIVVTGTAGLQQRRAVGNAVAKIDAARTVEFSPIVTATELINGRAAGVVVTPGTGMIGSGPRIRIRGASSFSLNDQPLIYIDGVRTNNQVASGLAIQGFGSGVVNRLNDINPEDIESIEIIKGPAAATLYGTEAANGVVQIITKKGGAAGKPRVSMSTRQGANWFNDPATRIPVTYWRNPRTGVIESQNIVEQEKARGTPIFRTGRLQGYHLDVGGGNEQFRYYVSTDYDNDKGIEPTNSQNRFSGRMNLSVAASSKIDFAASLGLISSRTNLVNEAGAGGIWFSTMFNTPELRDTPKRGFLFTPPEVVWQTQQPKQAVNRFTGSLQVNHRPLNWFNQRLTVGMDLTNEQDENLFERVTDPVAAQFLSASAIAGSKFIRTRAINYGTFDYGGTVTTSPTADIRSATSVGAQYYRTFVQAVAANGSGFPAPNLRTVDALAQTFGGDTYFENSTVGVFGQQQIGWKDRAFLTAALRADDNSAFGENFDLVYYPKVSASWVISEQPFWSFDFVDQLKLRTAYGQSGQQPETFAALQSYQPITAGNGGAAVTPQFLGNPDLAPERGEEIEVGFEAGFLKDRLSAEFTWYNKKTRDAILLKDVAPSLGFPGSQFVNIGELKNTGIEFKIGGVPLDTRNVDLDLTLNYSSNESKVVDLGGAPFITIGSQRHQVGFPVAAWFREKVVSADIGANGRATNLMCDGGLPDKAGGPPLRLGGAPVPCATAPRLYLGRASPKYDASLASTVTLFSRLRLIALVDYKGGHKAFDNNLRARCQIFLNCLETIEPTKHDAARVAEMQSSGTFVSFVINDATFAKLRELSASYTLPDRWAQRGGASRATLSVAGRNLHTWTNWTGLDPESFFVSNLHTRLEQDNTPQLRQFVTTLNVIF